MGAEIERIEPQAGPHPDREPRERIETMPDRRIPPKPGGDRVLRGPVVAIAIAVCVMLGTVLLLI